MNLYTLPENQKLIWDTISKVASFQQMRKSNPNKSEEWFRSIIQMYYNKSETTVFDKRTLTMLNKETIRYMLQDLKQGTQSPRQPEPLQKHQNHLQDSENHTQEHTQRHKHTHEDAQKKTETKTTKKSNNNK